MKKLIKFISILYITGTIQPAFSNKGFEPYYANTEDDVVIYQDDLFEKKTPKKNKKRKKAIQKMLKNLHRYKEFDQLEVSQVKKRKRRRKKSRRR